MGVAHRLDLTLDLQVEEWEVFDCVSSVANENSVVHVVLNEPKLVVFHELSHVRLRETAFQVVIVVNSEVKRGDNHVTLINQHISISRQIRCKRISIAVPWIQTTRDGVLKPSRCPLHASANPKSELAVAIPDNLSCRCLIDLLERNAH